MKILFTGDWQCSVQNLDKCRSVHEHLLEIISKNSVDLLVHLGDAKETMNPVDLRVTNFLSNSFKELSDVCKVFFLIGNHDRAGMSDQSEDIGPVLRKAGAEVFDEIGLHEFGGYYFWHFPYYRDRDFVSSKTKTKIEHPDKTFILFHDSIPGCRMNLQATSEDGIRLPKRSKYLAAFGGHIHLHQQIEDLPIWFVGSPFCQDWGEANQKKGFVYVDTNDIASDGKQKIITPEFISSRVPGYYDPELPGFTTPPKGSRVRVKLEYTTKDSVHRTIEKYKEEISKEYPGCIPYVVPKKRSKKLDIDLDTIGSSNSELLESFLNRNKVKFKEKTKAYLEHILEEVPTVDSGVVFESCSAFQYLNYKKVEIVYKKGLTLVQGRNEDWENSSNGSGKSNLLALPSVALFGRTPKGQKSDRWRRSGASGKTEVTLTAKLEDGRLVRVLRGRNPVRLELSIDGSDATMGDVHATQEKIEQLFGLTFDILLNGLYIDQNEINILVRGTDKQRKDLFSSFLKISRFEDAYEKVGEDLKKSRKLLDALEIRNDELESKIHDTKVSAKKLERDSNWKEYKKNYEKAQKEFNKNAPSEESILALTEELEVLNEELVEINKELRSVDTKFTIANKEKEDIIDLIEKAKELQGVCTECQQTITKEYVDKHLRSLRAIKNSKVKERNNIIKERKEVLDKKKKKISIIELKDEKHREKEKLRFSLKRQLENTESAYQQSLKVKDISEGLLQEAENLRELREDVIQEAIKLTEEDIEFLQECRRLVHRDGIPSYLISSICPKLNQSAAHYASLFTDDTIQVEFAVVNEDIDVVVTNISGGEQLIDQSAGELRMASLITAFSMRDVLSGYNLLILDEPGEGLDSKNAKKFAVVLNDLTSRFGSVFLTTHNSHIISALQPDRTLTVVKKDKVAEVHEGTFKENV